MTIPEFEEFFVLRAETSTRAWTVDPVDRAYRIPESRGPVRACRLYGCGISTSIDIHKRAYWVSEMCARERVAIG